MNDQNSPATTTETKTPEMPTSADASTTAPASATDTTAAPDQIERPLHRKIARLPKPLRDQINAMLDDSVPYNQIIEHLERSANPPLPYPITEMDLSRWKRSGYFQYLAQQELAASLGASCEAARDLVDGHDASTMTEATLQIIANQYFSLFVGFSPTGLKDKISEDPVHYTRLLNSFARLNREIVVLRKHRQECAKQERLKPFFKRPQNRFDRPPTTQSAAPRPFNPNPAAAATYSSPATATPTDRRP